jgi:hypothetical protein
MIIGGYTVHLCCDGDPHCLRRKSYWWQQEFTGPTEGNCYYQARKAGWKLRTARGKAMCPECVKKGYKL